MDELKPETAAIFGLQGLALSDEERDFFQQVQPIGYILFARNIDTPDQVKALTRDLRAISPDIKNLPILIDQEGGRVQRLRPPHWQDLPPAASYGDLFAHHPNQAKKACALGHRLIGRALHDLGITVNCAPVADVADPQGHPVIGDRAFSSDPMIATELAAIAASAFLSEGVLPVVKHVPGHGRANSDSHESLPVIETSLEDLSKRDFIPFSNLASLPLMMMAHVLYTELDPEHPASQSSEIIRRVLREKMGFDGLVLGDDVGMEALSGSMAERSRKMLEAGCDYVLHCSGDMEEMRAVAEATQKPAPAKIIHSAQYKWERAFLSCAGSMHLHDERPVAEIQAEFARLMQI